MVIARRAFVVAIGCALLLLPRGAASQSVIAGSVRDASGAVMPGVTVEASSPALIERVRAATTDEAGQFRIVDLRPGVYAVTFTLAGFTSFPSCSMRSRRAGASGAWARSSPACR